MEYVELPASLVDAEEAFREACDACHSQGFDRSDVPTSARYGQLCDDLDHKVREGRMTDRQAFARRTLWLQNATKEVDKWAAYFDRMSDAFDRSAANC